MAKDLRSYLEELKRVAPQQLRKVSRVLEPQFEPSGILRNLESQGLRPLYLVHLFEAEGLLISYPREVAARLPVWEFKKTY
ncbi:MAG: hypothetical protein A2169_02960 [Deltaproteobacteria bacterium RBG_13_47_9]|nr:MAG: hypothetical protein A2169_02960 [Deltaproteobacteria bacterium RBG_13_47_9]